MNFDDDMDGEVTMARQALRSLADQPAPPLSTDLSDLMARGRRRLLAQRLAAGLGVVAVLGAVALGASLLAHHPGSGNGITAATNGPTVSTTAPAPISGTVLPGWSTVPVVPAEPRSTVTTSPGGKLPSAVTTTSSPGRVASTAPQAVVDTAPALRVALTEVLATQHVTAALTTSASTGALVATFATGSLRVQQLAMSGPPADTANTELDQYPNATVQRETLPNGAVLQLYTISAGTQALDVYLPAGAECALYLASNGTPPLTEAQLAAVGEHLATLR